MPRGGLPALACSRCALAPQVQTTHTVLKVDDPGGGAIWRMQFGGATAAAAGDECDADGCRVAQGQIVQ